MRIFLISSTLLLASCSMLMPPLGCGLSHPASDVQLLMDRACEGDKTAALNLGKLYEHGDEVEQDYKKAAQLYREAATADSGMTSIYVPGAGSVSGFTMPVQTGSYQAGIPEAMYRLGLLYEGGLGVKHDPVKAEKLLNRARLGGFIP